MALDLDRRNLDVRLKTLICLLELLMLIKDLLLDLRRLHSSPTAKHIFHACNPCEDVRVCFSRERYRCRLTMFEKRMLCFDSGLVNDSGLD